MIHKDSSEKVKAISGFNVIIYYRDHDMGENVKFPRCIGNNRNIIDFSNNESKCLMYCVVYHNASISGNTPLSKRTTGLTKEAVSKYLKYKGVEYSYKLFKDFKPIDLLKFDNVEDCFEINIDVFEMDSKTFNIRKIRPSEKSYNSILTVLEYCGHALYVSDAERGLAKYVCSKCDMVFTEIKKMLNHKR